MAKDTDDNLNGYIDTSSGKLGLNCFEFKVFKIKIGRGEEKRTVYISIRGREFHTKSQALADSYKAFDYELTRKPTHGRRFISPISAGDFADIAYTMVKSDMCRGLVAEYLTKNLVISSRICVDAKNLTYSHIVPLAKKKEECKKIDAAIPLDRKVKKFIDKDGTPKLNDAGVPIIDKTSIYPKKRSADIASHAFENLLKYFCKADYAQQKLTAEFRTKKPLLKHKLGRDISYDDELALLKRVITISPTRKHYATKIDVYCDIFSLKKLLDWYLVNKQITVYEYFDILIKDFGATTNLIREINSYTFEKYTQDMFDYKVKNINKKDKKEYDKYEKAPIYYHNFDVLIEKLNLYDEIVENKENKFDDEDDDLYLDYDIDKEKKQTFIEASLAVEAVMIAPKQKSESKTSRSNNEDNLIPQNLITAVENGESHANVIIHDEDAEYYEDEDADFESYVDEDDITDVESKLKEYLFCPYLDGKEKATIRVFAENEKHSHVVAREKANKLDIDYDILLPV